MYNYKIKTNFVSPEMPKGCANKTGFNIIIVHFYNTIRYMIFHYGLEPVLIQRILISFKAILEYYFSDQLCYLIWWNTFNITRPYNN